MKKLVLQLEDETVEGLEELRRRTEVRLGQRTTLEEIVLAILKETIRRNNDLSDQT